MQQEMLVIEEEEERRRRRDNEGMEEGKEGRKVWESYSRFKFVTKNILRTMARWTPS